jgi:hypothetical protein
MEFFKLRILGIHEAKYAITGWTLFGPICTISGELEKDFLQRQGITWDWEKGGVRCEVRGLGWLCLGEARISPYPHEIARSQISGEDISGKAVWNQNSANRGYGHDNAVANKCSDYAEAMWLRL